MADDKLDKSIPGRLRQHRASLADFGLEAFRGDDLDALLSSAAMLVSTALDVRLVKILQLQAGGEELLVRAGVNWKSGVVGHATIGAGVNSPAGFALHTGEPVISADISRESRFRIPPLLAEHGVRSLVNVIIPGETSPFGVLEIDSTGTADFGQDEVDFLRNYANLIAAAIARIETRDRLKALAGERDLLLREVRHRVKNMLMVVDTLASQTSTQGRTAEEFREILLGRLRAFERAERMVFDEQGDTFGLRALLAVVLKAYLVTGRERIRFDGPEVTLDARQARALGMIVHELAANASMYGALSRDDGAVAVSWHVRDDEPDRLALSWLERGGPPAKPPVHKGFGVRLVSQAVAVQLKGSAEIVYAREGLRCEIVFPLRKPR